MSRDRGPQRQRRPGGCLPGKWRLMVFAAVAVVIVVLALPRERRGTRYWYEDHTFHFQALRALQYAPAEAADANEVLTAVGQTVEGDPESWYRAWYGTAETVEAMAGTYMAPRDQASALLRAQNYYRTAEFFLPGTDPRRNDTWHKQEALFETALDLRGVKRETLRVPYEGKTLKAVFYPAAGPFDVTRPLIIGFNGWDGTIVETYHRLVPEGTRRGYNVLVYEGPGQGSVLREQKLLFTHEWERPNTAVVDHFVRRYGKPGKVVVFGESLGAVLAMRAAAKDVRIDGVVAFGVLYDALEISRSQTPWIVGWLYDRGYRRLLNFGLRQAGNADPMVGWGLGHATWTMGLKDEAGALDAMKNYHLRDVLGDIRGDVLLMSGTADHFMVRSDQHGRTKRGLVNARSVSEVVFRVGEGGEEHCQIGALLQMQAELFRWVEAKFRI